MGSNSDTSVNMKAASTRSPSYDEAEVRKPSKRQSCARHCKRFWWIYLITFILGVVLAVCLIIFVIIPKIAQDKINSANLTIDGVSITQTTPNTYYLNINSTITTDGSISATVFGFAGDLYLEDLPDHTPFLTVEFPNTNGNSFQTVNISEPIVIQNEAAFETFNQWFFLNDTVRVTISGNTHVQPAGLSRQYPITFTKTVTLNGLNKFAGTQVTEGKILTDAKSPYNFNGTAVIPNQSIYTIDVGNATFTNFIKDTNVGNLTIENFTLYPGNNTVNILANLNNSDVITTASTKPYCQSGIVPFKLTGSEVMNHGQSIEYLQKALGSGNQTVDIDIGKILKSSLNFTLACA